MQKQQFVQLLKDHKVSTLSTTTDSAVAAIAPVVTQLRSGGVKGKTLADWAIEAGVSSKSASSLISDFHAVGSYLRDYPEKMVKLTEEHAEKVWRKMFLCPARRVHRLKKGSSAERDAKAEVLQHHGRASLQVATALKTWQDNAPEIEQALDVLKHTRYQDVAVVAPVVEDVVEKPVEEFTVEELAQELQEFAEPVAEVVAEVTVEAVEEVKPVQSHKQSKKKGRK